MSWFGLGKAWEVTVPKISKLKLAMVVRVFEKTFLLTKCDINILMFYKFFWLLVYLK